MKNTTTSAFAQAEQRAHVQIQKFMRSHRDTLVLGGYGERLKVENGSLWALRGTDKEEFIAGEHGLRTILYMPARGIGGVANNVKDWCSTQKIQIICISSDGTLEYMNTIKSKNFSELRKRQWLLEDKENDVLALNCYVYKMKLLAQSAILREFSEVMKQDDLYTSQELVSITSWLDDINSKSDSIDKIRHIEMYGAKAYFAMWHGMPIVWKDAKNVSSYWKQYDKRHVGTKGSNRNATHPLNCLLNYGYAVLATRVRLACIAKGLDLYASFNHARHDDRENLVYDLVEPVRPYVDAFVLKLAQNGTLESGMFVAEKDPYTRQPTGTVRINPAYAVQFAAQLVAALDDAKIHSIVDEYCNFLMCEAASAKKAA